MSRSGSERRAAALVQVDEYIAGIPGAGRLAPEATKRYHARGYDVGWQVPALFSDGTCRQLHVIVDSDFPYTPPRIAVADGPGALAWPHLEKDGLLCVLPPDTAVSSEKPADVAAFVLGDACRLINESISGSNAEEFRREFLSYWAMAADSVPVFLNTADPTFESQRIAVWRTEGMRVVGKSPTRLRRWLTRWGAQPRRNGQYTLCDGVLIWLPKPLIPAEYPDTPADVRTLALQHSPEMHGVLEDLAVQCVSEIDVIFGARTAHGSCFGAVVLSRPASLKLRNGDPIVKGFRLGRVPARLLVARYFSTPTKAPKAIVKRADHLWIHGRDNDRRQARLRGASVAVLGCGSLGGPLARLLAQAGVGRLLLVDPATLDWPNIGRHSLGAGSVEQPKALALAREIEAAYPHLAEIAARNKRVGMGEGGLMDDLLMYDLVVSTMGNWAAESFLNDYQQEREGFPPVLYGWLEPHASAAHAVVVPKHGACLRCGVNDKGRPNLAVTDWANDGDSLQEPACGAQYTPYGPAELCWAHALICETAIDAIVSQPATAHHYVWIGRRHRVAEVGGTWAPTWIAEMGDPGVGGLTVERPWRQSASCPACISPITAA